MAKNAKAPKLEKKRNPKEKATAPDKEISLAGEQQRLGITTEEQPGPITVVNGRVLAEFVKPHFSRDQNDDRYISLEFAVKLTEAHTTILPRKVLDAWTFVAEGGGEGVRNIPVKPQTVYIHATSDSKEEELLLVGTVVESAKVDIVEERGKGEAVKITRYSFRLLTERLKNVVTFACWQDGKSFWLDMKPTQASLLS